MKQIFAAISKILKRQRGFTLVEMVTVVAIMGVMAAVAVPMVNNQLGKTREKSYIQDKAMIQTAVDSFFTAADNVRHLGQRQFPLLGSSVSKGNTDIPADTGTVLFDETAAIGVILQPVNPLRGTQGGDPKWRDGNQDGNRKLDTDGLPVKVDQTTGAIPAASGSEEALNNANASFNNKTEAGGWYVDKITFQGANYSVDTRAYIIDFRLLVDAGLLQNIPESASPDNGGGSTDGSYVWYVKRPVRSSHCSTSCPATVTCSRDRNRRHHHHRRRPHHRHPGLPGRCLPLSRKPQQQPKKLHRPGRWSFLCPVRWLVSSNHILRHR